MKKTAKKSPAKKTAKKQPAAKKTAAKKTAKKAPAKKTAKKSPAKKAPAKKTAKKAPAKKAAKKSPAKKTAKKAPAKKAAKKAPAKRAAKKTAAKKAPARKAAKRLAVGEQTERLPTAAPVETTNLGSRIAPGDRLVVSLGDNDALDRYTFTVTRFDDDGLALAWQMEGAGDHGDLVYTRHALDEATNRSLMSQGSTLYVDDTDTDARVDGSMPPFLVSRAFLSGLHAGEIACAHPATNQTHTYRIRDRGQQTITFGGAEISVPTVTAEADSDELEIVDDPSFPLVLRHAEWGDEMVLFHEHH